MLFETEIRSEMTLSLGSIAGSNISKLLYHEQCKKRTF